MSDGMLQDETDSALNRPLQESVGKSTPVHVVPRESRRRGNADASRPDFGEFEAVA